VECIFSINLYLNSGELARKYAILRADIDRQKRSGSLNKNPDELEGPGDARETRYDSNGCEERIP
jgi:hypothetical protein